MDAKWERDGVRQVESRGEPFAVGEPTPCFFAESSLTILNGLQLSEVMSGATYLHELGIVHGDIKGVPLDIPSPFFCLTDGLSRQIFLLTTVAPLALLILVS